MDRPRRRRRPALAVEGPARLLSEHYFGVEREVRAVDDISLHRRPQRDLRPRRRIELRQDDADQDHRRRHPAAADASIGGSVCTASAIARDIYALSPGELSAIRWKHLSYIMQGSMSVLNPVRRVRQSFIDFAFAISAARCRTFLRRGRAASAAARSAAERARRLSARAFRRHAPARHDRARDDLPARNSSSPTSRPRRSTSSCRRDVLAMIRESQQQIGSSHDVRHARHGRARQYRRPPRHHVCGPAGRGGADRRDLPPAAASLHRAPGREPAAHRRAAAPGAAWRARRRISPIRRAAAASIRAARWPWTFAASASPALHRVAPGHRVACLRRRVESDRRRAADAPLRGTAGHGR